jgi:hypothetical protein
MSYADRVQEITGVTDAAVIPLSGAVPGFRTFTSAYAANTSGIPAIVEDDYGNYELILCTLSAANVLARNSIIGSSNGGAAVAFPAGPKRVYSSLMAAHFAEAYAARIINCTWAARPSNPVPGMRICVTNLGNRVFVWTGGVWAPASMLPFAHTNASVLTGNTGGTTTLATITVPGGMLGPNGFIRLYAMFSYPATANAKTFRLQHNGVTMFFNDNGGSASAIQTLWGGITIRNKNSQSVQVGHPAYGASSSARVAGAVDTTVDSTLTITAATVAPDVVTLESYTVEIVPSL